MIDTLLVLNAGSSSLKFSVFLDSDPPELLVRGQLESLLTQPRFVARNATGQILDEHIWPAGSPLAHQGAIEYLFAWGQQGKLGDIRLVAAGHRIVHGGTKFTQAVRIDDGVLAELDLLVPLAPLHQPHNLAAI